jgi:catechol 2,3-dioxygenase-like lactoylglutathione lyase family enzyme
MPIIKVRGMAYVRLSAPDLDVMEKFLLDFGLQVAERTDDRLYSRGIGPDHHIHITQKGPAGFLGFAYKAASEEDLHTLAREAPGASPVEDRDEPGGGKRVRLVEPNGFTIEVVHGMAMREGEGLVLTKHHDAATPSQSMGPARVVRLGHCVLATPRHLETIDWFRNTLGLLKTDDLYMGTPDNVFGSFSRADAGAEPVDHHVFFCFKGDRVGMHHCSFEVADVNDVFIGHNHLTKQGYDHIRGVGRHALGSQIFDYWTSPYDQMHELWSSNETFNASSGSGAVAIGPGMSHDTGEAPSERFTKQSTPAPQAT